ncbi:MAG: hypothetical protein CFH05_01183, partial [Alphaproteobacteria bacterium MarineAlpha3_Bin4]
HTEVPNLLNLVAGNFIAAALGSLLLLSVLCT